MTANVSSLTLIADLPAAALMRDTSLSGLHVVISASMRLISSIAASNVSCVFFASTRGVVYAANAMCVPIAAPDPCTRSETKARASRLGPGSGSVALASTDFAGSSLGAAGTLGMGGALAIGWSRHAVAMAPSAKSHIEHSRAHARGPQRPREQPGFEKSTG